MIITNKLSALAPAFIAGFMLVATSASAWADKAAGDACAAQLTPDGKAIYAAVGNATGDLRAIITETTKSLAFSGKINGFSARSNAEAAAKCIQVARS